nr:uncharacterized protein LOC111425118 [Onthophagus taurus]
MNNGEQVHRRWLVYSKSTDKAFCFCCKLYGNDTGSQLANDGYSDWAHLGRTLDNHEKSAIHGQNVGKWTDCEIRLAEASTIDKQHIKLINKEKEHWREVLNSIIKKVHDALDEVVEATDDPKAKSEARSLVNELMSYEFLVALAIWYDVLFAVNSVSQTLQAEKMHLRMASQLLQGLVQFLEQFRNEGFVAAIMVAREMSKLLDIEPKFQIVKQRKKRKMFDYEGDEHDVESAEQIFKIEYFYYIVNCILQSLSRRFQQVASYNSMFGFLYSVKELKSIEQGQLLEKCKALEASLSFEEQKDICGNDLFTELKVLRGLLPAEVETAAGVLRFMNRIQNPYPNTFIAYRILLTIPVTVASAERSFSRLKLTKTYLRSSMSQERLTSLATLSIEADTTAKVNFGKKN